MQPKGDRSEANEGTEEGVVYSYAVPCTREEPLREGKDALRVTRIVYLIFQF
jgi:hypothetical protein